MQCGTAIKQNLIDAGCNEWLIGQIMLLQSERKTNEMISLLAEHRRHLLDGVHAEERKIYCLDYLVNQLANKFLN